MRDVRDCILCLKLSQIKWTKLRTSCILAEKVSKIHSKRTSVCPRTGTFFVPAADWRAKFSRPLNLGRNTPLLSFSFVAVLLLGFHPTSYPILFHAVAVAYEASSDTGPLVISSQVFPARRIVRYLMKVWWRKQKLRNYVVLFGGVPVPRFRTTKWLDFIKSPLRRRITYLCSKKIVRQSFCYDINRR